MSLRFFLKFTLKRNTFILESVLKRNFCMICSSDLKIVGGASILSTTPLTYKLPILVLYNHIRVKSMLESVAALGIDGHVVRLLKEDIWRC